MLTTTSISTFTSLTFPTGHYPLKKKNNLKNSAHITIAKRHPSTLGIFPSTEIRLNHDKKYILPLKQPQTSLKIAFTPNSKSPSSTSTTTVLKSPPKSKIPHPTSPKPIPKISPSITIKERSRKSTSPTTTTTTAHTKYLP